MASCSISFCGKLRGKKQRPWRVFSLKELISATNNFNYDNKLCEVAFGNVYWGQLSNGSEIQVKIMKAWSEKSDKEFIVEIEILARVQHKNVLGLRGYCVEGQERLIVYDYMPNWSLHSHIHGQNSADSLLDWNRRMNIAIGSAKGIAFLHHQATPFIIHSDIKASSVLLDSDFNPRVSDFGFAKSIHDRVAHVGTRVKGSLCYLAPEYTMLGEANESCDVYSFGIILLQLATGRKVLVKLSTSEEQLINHWALPLACEKKFSELADPRLNGNYVEEEVKRVILVALICSQNQPEKRPNMLEVVELLRGESKAMLSQLENNELFLKSLSVGQNDGTSIAEGISEFISEKKESKDNNTRLCNIQKL